MEFVIGCMDAGALFTTRDFGKTVREVPKFLAEWLEFNRAERFHT